MPSTRTLLAVIAVILMGVAVVGWVHGDEALAGVSVRVGLVCAAVWLAWPNLTAVPRRSWWILAASLAILLARPRAAILVIPVLLWVTSMGRRK